MSHEFDLGFYGQQQQIRDMSFWNNKSDSQSSSVMRSQLSVTKIPRVEGLTISMPNIENDIRMPYIQDFLAAQERGNAFTPAPPVIRNQSQKALWKVIKKFSSKYQYLWVLITEPAHPSTVDFAELYYTQKISNVNHNLENMLPPENYDRALLFTREGLIVKIAADFHTYQKYLKRNMPLFENNPKIVQIFVEREDNPRQGIQTTKKVRKVQNLSAFIQQEVKQDVQNCRRDRPFYNFINPNSGPELYNRRSIIKNCLSMKLQEEFLRNHQNFVKVMEKYNRDEKQRRDTEIAKRGENIQQKLQDSRKKHQLSQEHTQRFAKQFTKILTKSYPMQALPESNKKQIYNWIIIQYCIESAVYPVVNNTIRFSTNNEGLSPISTYVKYLYDALRFYFTTRYREITYDVVYRGSRVSLVEQMSFKAGRYLWNLGFMSTSRSEKTAYNFIAAHKNSKHDPNEVVLIVIKLSNLVNQLQYLWDQEGFFSLDRIPQITKNIIPGQEEVLFNPLNVFKIINWDNDKKVLTLQYAPQLEILEKKRKRIKINEQEEDFLRSLAKLKDSDFDKGQQLLDEGDPGSAIKYYQLSDETGSNLSFTQKSNYIKGLMEVGSLQKMQTILKDSLEQERSAEEQLLSSKASTSISKISDSLQTMNLLHETTDILGANQRAQLIATKSIKMPTQESLLLEAQTYIQLAKAKYGISDTYDSIRESIRGLKIIDELANINFCYRLWEIGNDLKKIGKFRWDKEIEVNNFRSLIQDDGYLASDISRERTKTLSNLQKIRQWQKGQIVIQNISTLQQSKTKSDHMRAETLLNQYFGKRDKRTDIQRFEQKFIKAYWQAELVRVDREGINEKQQIQLKEKFKACLQKMFQVKNQYKQLFQHEIAAYEVLYRNIYKTSIDVSSCLQSYVNNVYRRLEDYSNTETKYEGQSIDSAEVLWKHAEILYEYGQIIERPKSKKKDGKTDAQKLAQLKMQQTQQAIARIEAHQSRITGKNIVVYTYQKTQLRRTLSRYFKSKIIDRERCKKLSLIHSESMDEKSELPTSASLSSSEKSQVFSSLLSIFKQTNELCQSDSSINQPLYKIKNASDKIETMNESASVVEKERSYLDRLRSCRKQFDDVMSTIDKYKEKQLMERNINMAHLYLLMGQNQFKLGLIANAREYLRNAGLCLRKALKLDDKKYEKSTLVNREKAMLGNATHLGCLRLEASIVSYFGTREQKKNTYQLLRKKKKIISSTMNQPLSQAEIDQAIGLVAAHMVLLHKQLGYSYSHSRKPYLEAIKIRDRLIGPYNRHNAASYTMLVNMVSDAGVREAHYQQIARFYEEALRIYDRMDLSHDSGLIIYRMQLRSTFLIFSFRNKEACQVIISDLKEFASCPSKKMTLETGKQLHKCCAFLLTEPKYQKVGLFWMKYTYKYVAKLQEFVDRIYGPAGSGVADDASQKKVHLLGLKGKILQSIIAAEYKINNKEIDEQYYKLYQDHKAKHADREKDRTS